MCGGTAPLEPFALLLTSSAQLITSLLALLAAESDRKLRQVVASAFAAMMLSRNRQVARRLVHEYRTLPAIIGALRDGFNSDDEELMLMCLAFLINVLRVGDEEALDDPRGINPYIEPIDWLGAFEIVDPLRSHAYNDAHLAEKANAVSAYFIPNECE